MAKNIVFTQSPLNRAGHLRRDSAWLQTAAQAADARYLALIELKPLIAVGQSPAIHWLDAAALQALGGETAGAVFLGLDGESPRFAQTLAAPCPIDGKIAKAIDVRTIAAQLPLGEAAILAQARCLIDWHGRHGFCALCGQASLSIDGGYARRCRDQSCGAQHFPRTDPVAIMLIVQKDRCLLGRQPGFAAGVYSALAGFVEPGESIEEAVRREALEESGVTIGAVRYVASQPWPFPSNLMLGCIAEALTQEITIDQTELQDARWWTRDQVAAMARNSLDPAAERRLPPPLSLAHQLALHWLAG